MSDNTHAQRSEASIIRDLVGDWFLGNFENGAVIRMETGSGSHYQLEIETGKVEGIRVKDTSLFYHVRRASVIRNGVKIKDARYVGFSTPTATLAIMNGDKRILQTSSTITRLAHLETVT